MYGWSAIQEGQGLVLMTVGMAVVFSALVLLLFLMLGLKRYEEWVHLRKQRKQVGDLALDNLKIEASEDIPGTVVAAIALTLIFEDDLVHDEEALVLTLRSLSKPYSNWWQSRIERSAPMIAHHPRQSSHR